MATQNSIVRIVKRGLSSASGLEDYSVPQSKWWTQASLSHHVVIIAVIISALVRLPHSDKTYGLVAALTVFGLGSSIVVDIWTHKTKRLHYQMMWLDQIYIASIVAVFPQWWAPVFMAGIAALAAEGILFPPRTTAVGAGVGTAAMWGALRFNYASFWGAPSHGVVAYLVIGLAVATAAATVSLARERSEKDLRRFANIMEKIPVGIYVFHLDPSIPDRGEIDPSMIVLISSNPATISTTGVDISSLVGSSFADVNYQLPNSGQFYSLLRRVHLSGAPFKIDIDVTPNEDSPGLKTGVYSLQIFSVGNREVAVSIEDISERVGAQNALMHQALHDGVTDLPNRVQLHQRLVGSLAMAEKSGQSVSLLIVDVNQFKEINDTLGHQFGDQLLRQFGERLSSVIGPSDILARLGGDEFAIARISQDADSTSLELTSKIQGVLEAPFMLSGIPVRASGSIGIANFPDHGRDAEALLQKADMALFAAKRNGVGKSTYTPDSSHFNIRRLTLLGELGPAIDRGEMVLHYQPKIDLTTGRAVGMEALVRWQHPRRGLLSPAHFVELAEISGLINQLTRWVGIESVRQVQEWRKQGLDLHLAANISVRNLHDYSLLDWLEELLSESGLPPEKLMLEITESAIIDEMPIVEEMLHKISSLGIHTSVDDFGTGYSSLSTLRRLAINELKMDRSFVANMISEEHDYAIVRSMIDLSHTLGIQVTAEGVEDRETLDLLVNLGCDRTQGYYISKPLPPDDFKSWIQEKGMAAFELTEEQIVAREKIMLVGNGEVSASIKS